MSVGIEHPLINHPHIQPVSANAAAAATAITHVDNDKKPMKQQLNRRRSFINWPCAHVTPDELAEEGFYYTQSRDIVKCAFCGLELGKWQAGDVPAVDHRTWSPACPLVRRAECGNVRMSDADRSSVLADQQQQSASSPAANYDTCGKYGIHVRVNSGPENGTPVDVRRYAVKHTSAHPHYVMRDERLRTFKDWPVSIKQRPAELADAGFFYSGKGDQTICYSCGGGLKAWEEADDPWEQHASWFPACSYLRMHKTAEYIALHNKVSNKDIAAVGNAAAAGTSQQEPAAAPARPVRSLNSTQAPPTPSTQSATVTSSAPSSAASAKDPNHPGQPVNLCKICFQKEVGVVFLPCGHMVACVECGAALDKCAVCRRELEATVRAFLS